MHAMSGREMEIDEVSMDVSVFLSNGVSVLGPELAPDASDFPWNSHRSKQKSARDG